MQGLVEDVRGCFSRRKTQTKVVCEIVCKSQVLPHQRDREGDRLGLGLEKRAALVVDEGRRQGSVREDVVGTLRFDAESLGESDGPCGAVTEPVAPPTTVAQTRTCPPSTMYICPVM